jgi:hypothetical protein
MSVELTCSVLCAHPFSHILGKVGPLWSFQDTPWHSVLILFDDFPL